MNISTTSNKRAYIDLQNVSLTFHKFGPKRSFKETFISWFSSKNYGRANTFSVLKNISLSINTGEKVGIIGKNGSGKTTLLKLITGIYRPVEGRIRVTGHIVPLLEIATGANPQLSGEENVYLISAMYGKNPYEIKNKINDIFSFAGLENFAQTPVKYYSSGMKSRLMFSIATTLNPEIMLNDEVFAGGDEEFKHKAKKRLDQMIDKAHISVFVSHNLQLLRQLPVG